MKLSFVLIVLIVFLLIQSSQSRGRKDPKSEKKPIPNRVIRKPVQSMSASRNPTKKAVKTRGIASGLGKGAGAVGSAVGSVAGVVSKKVTQVLVLIKCVLKCFVTNLLNLKICSQMFPCLYDCFIGQEYIPPNVQKELDKYQGGSASWPTGITFESIFNQLKCIFKCGTETGIRNWETFVYVLYCFADSCICYTMFGA